MKTKDKKKEYTVRYKDDGATTKNTFFNITEARNFANSKRREGSFVSFKNINGIPLTL